MNRRRQTTMIRIATIAMALLTALQIAGPAAAARQRRMISEKIYEQYIVLLNLEETQREIADALFAEYEQTRLEGEVRQRVLDYQAAEAKAFSEVNTAIANDESPGEVGS